jgi:hypothetical protein
VLYVVYQKSESIEKMRYSVLFELIDHGKVPGLNAQSSEGARKRPESSSPEKLKARNKEKFSGSSLLNLDNTSFSEKFQLPLSAYQ